MSIPGADSSLTVAVVYPDLLGTYGDGGNGLVLARRASWRGVGVRLIQANSGRPLPTADIYCIGGGEDGPLPHRLRHGALRVGIRRRFNSACYRRAGAANWRG